MAFVRWDLGLDKQLAQMVMGGHEWGEVARTVGHSEQVCQHQWDIIRDDWESTSLGRRISDRRRGNNFDGSPDTAAKKKRMEMDDYTCQICRRAACDGVMLHVHHIIPAAQGGTGDTENLITLCAGCHRSVESGNADKAARKCAGRAMRGVAKRMNEAEAKRHGRRRNARRDGDGDSRRLG